MFYCFNLDATACTLVCRIKNDKFEQLGFLFLRLPEAAKALSQEIEFYNQVDNNGLVNKLVMGLVLVHLHLGDSVAASKVYHSALRYACF